MVHSFRSLAGLGASLVFVMLTASYQCQAASSDKTTTDKAAQRQRTLSTPTAAAAPAPSDTNTNKRLRAAAEPFEKLTEISFSAALTTIDETIVEAEKAAREIRGLLSKDAEGRLDAQLSAVNSSRQKQDRAELALSSIEAYRVLVSAVTTDAKVPTGVSILDYAGFRYDADLKASPVRWGDMAQAVSFARENWLVLSSRAKLSPTATDFDKVLAEMDKAVTERSEPLAASAVRIELDLVDQLEKFFSTR